MATAYKGDIGKLKSLATRQKVAKRIADVEGVSYKSAMRRLQRYVTTAGEKRNVARSTKLEAVRDVVPYKKIKARAKAKARKLAPKAKAPRRPKSKAFNIQGIRKLAEYVRLSRYPVHVEMKATYDFYGSDRRHRRVVFSLNADEAKQLLAIARQIQKDEATIQDAADFLIQTNGAGFMDECEVYQIDSIKVL